MRAAAPPVLTPAIEALTRDRIKAAAGDLYVRRGHDGFSFADIAEATGTTRANIHYHFGTKRRLIAEIVADFAADAITRIGGHWTMPNDFAARWVAQRDDLHRFYSRFNPTGVERSVWSPMSRLRLDMDALGAVATQALDTVNQAYENCLRCAVTDAIAAGELRRETPVEDIVRLMRVTMLSCGTVTQDTGSFSDVERLFAAMADVIAVAWGNDELRARLSAALGRV
jgi:AcrR family transcriptional regulator